LGNQKTADYPVPLYNAPFSFSAKKEVNFRKKCRKIQIFVTFFIKKALTLLYQRKHLIKRNYAALLGEAYPV